MKVGTVTRSERINQIRCTSRQENVNEEKIGNEGIGFGRDYVVVFLTRKQSLIAKQEHELASSGRPI